MAIDSEDTKTELPAIEAICMSKPRNAHIIRVYEFWFEKNMDLSRTFIRMDKCRGTLEDYLQSMRKNGKLIEPFELTEIMIQMLEGLYHCHVQGFTHRDLKLTNSIAPPYSHI